MRAPRRGESLAQTELSHPWRPTQPDRYGSRSPVRRPASCDTATLGGYLPLAPTWREGLDVHLVAARLVRLIGEELAVRRKLRAGFGCRASQQLLWLGRVIQRQIPDVARVGRACFKCQVSAIRRCMLVMRGLFDQDLRLT